MYCKLHVPHFLPWTGNQDVAKGEDGGIRDGALVHAVFSSTQHGITECEAFIRFLLSTCFGRYDARCWAEMLYNGEFEGFWNQIALN